MVFIQPKATWGIKQDRCNVTNGFPGFDTDQIMHWCSRIACPGCCWCSWEFPHRQYRWDRKHDVTWKACDDDGASTTTDITNISEVRKRTEGVVCEAKKGYIWNPSGCPDYLQKILKDMDSQGFELNPYNPCMVNNMISHVDDKEVTQKIK